MLIPMPILALIHMPIHMRSPVPMPVLPLCPGA